ncbi:type VII secretion target [Amycolatopsis sp.]|uniref:type VII secretion target n=1 Tax=Amycolatopsis sp. TaxID=37632 RepID=UPI002CD95F71|nr:type VII secretion target [Amycolatopsis sp.]HVV09503.1 type VII secretion target [Amycolatopsis sp.]
MTDNGSGGYQVRTDELTTHAKAVDGVTETLAQALSAAEQVTLGVQAYGMICGPLFVPIVLAVSAPGLVTLGLAKETMGSVSESVTKAANAYDSVEQAHAKALTDLGRELA